MNYYKYANSLNLTIHEIYTTVYNYRHLAMARYGVNWEDAIDDTFHHILEHYDKSKGELGPYVHRIINTIHLNKYAHETNRGIGDGEETELDVESDKRAVELDSETNPYNLVMITQEDNIEYQESLKACVDYLLPYFLVDYEFFKTKDTSLRNRSVKYTDLFKKFSYKEISEAMDILNSYYKQAKYIKTLSDSCHIKGFGDDRYQKSLDKTLSYEARIGDIIRCKAVGAVRRKYPYLLDIKDVLGRIFIMFYDEDGVASTKIGDTTVYCSLSGKLLLSKEELFHRIENEIIGSILARNTNLKVLHYEKGKEMILLSTKEEVPSIVISMFKAGIYIPLTRLVMGKVEK